MAVAVTSGRWETAIEHARSLLKWLKKDGFPPNISGNHLFDKIVPEATCEKNVQMDDVIRPPLV